MPVGFQKGETFCLYSPSQSAKACTTTPKFLSYHGWETPPKIKSNDTSVTPLEGLYSNYWPLEVMSALLSAGHSGVGRIDVTEVHISSLFSRSDSSEEDRNAK